MEITRRQVRQAKKEKSRLKKKARQLLHHKHRVDYQYITGQGGILKYIAYFRPELGTLQGIDRIRAFVYGEHPVLGAIVPQKPKQQKFRIDPNTDAFLESYEWRRVRMVVLKRDGARCACCGATPTDGVRMHVDHIKPRKLFPELALDPANLQVLCEVCNHGKGNWDDTDWRGPAANDEQQQHIRSILMEGK
jgi:hypothetical protein